MVTRRGDREGQPLTENPAGPQRMVLPAMG